MLSFVPFQKNSFPQWRGLPLLQYFANQKSSLPVTSIQELNPVHQIWFFEHYFVVLDSLPNMNPTQNDQWSSQLFHQIHTHSKKSLPQSGHWEILSEKPILCGYCANLSTAFLWNDYLYFVCTNGFTSVWKFSSSNEWTLVHQMTLPFPISHSLFHSSTNQLICISHQQLLAIDFFFKEHELQVTPHTICSFSVTQKEPLEYDFDHDIHLVTVKSHASLLHGSKTGVWILDSQYWFHITISNSKVHFYKPLPNEVMLKSISIQQDQLLVLCKNGFVKRMETPQSPTILLQPHTFPQSFHHGMESYLNYPEKNVNFQIDVTSMMEGQFLVVNCNHQSMSVYHLPSNGTFLLQTILPSEIRQEMCHFSTGSMLFLPHLKQVYQIHLPNWNEIIKLNKLNQSDCKQLMKDWNQLHWSHYFELSELLNGTTKPMINSSNTTNTNPSMVWTAPSMQSLQQQLDQSPSLQQFLSQFPIEKELFWKMIDKPLLHTATVKESTVKNKNQFTPLNLQTVPLLLESYTQLETIVKHITVEQTSSISMKKEESKQWNENLIHEMEWNDLIPFKKQIVEWIGLESFDNDATTRLDYLEWMEQVQSQFHQQVSSISMDHLFHHFLYSNYLHQCMYENHQPVVNDFKLEKIMKILFFEGNHAFAVLVLVLLLEKTWYHILKQNKAKMENLLQSKAVSVSEVHSKLNQTNAKLNQNVKQLLSQLILQHCNYMLVTSGNGLQTHFSKSISYTKEQILCLAKCLELNHQMNQGLKLLLANGFVLEAHQYLSTIYLTEEENDEELIPLLETETKEQRQEIVYILKQFCYHSTQTHPLEAIFLLKTLHQRLSFQTKQKNGMELFQLYEYHSSKKNEESILLEQGSEELTVEFFKKQLLELEEEMNSPKSKFIYK